MRVEPIAGALGAEIHGVRLSRDIDDETVAAPRRAWLEHLVRFFRNQDLPPTPFLAFARRFGQPIESPFLRGLDDFPEIIPVLKLETERVNFGGIWNSDTARRALHCTPRSVHRVTWFKIDEVMPSEVGHYGRL